MTDLTTIHARRARTRPAARLLCAVLALLLAGPAFAWKPRTHVYLAEQVVHDAVDDGRVRIHQVDHASGRTLGLLGEFEVRPEIVAALRANPAQYYAGVVGPDAYPDVMTGQQVIHPGTNLSLLGRPAANEPASAPGTDAWLTHLWRSAYGRPDATRARLAEELNGTPLGTVLHDNTTHPIRAFVAGYLTHAAGDMFMHTFVNHYAGGDFALQPDPRNAIKHIVLEGYVGKRTPDTHAEVSIEGVEGFIYREMVRASPDSVLEERLLTGSGTAASVPGIFSKLRNGLKRDVDAYERERLARRGPSRVAYAAAHGPAAEYKKAWIEDIDAGLQAWPSVSHQISLALVYNPRSDRADVERAKRVASDFVGDHLLSMAGAPDALVATAQFISDVVDAILPDFMLAPLEALKKELLNWLVRSATGMSVDEIKTYLDHPETQFDPVMNSAGGGHGGRRETLISLAAFNRDVLGIRDAGAGNLGEKFDPDGFAPAFNTMQMTKVLFLSERGMTDLLAALRAKGVAAPALPTVPPYENAMLGFLTSIDGDNRWQGGGAASSGATAMFLARNGGEAWRSLFMRQVGERGDAPADRRTPEAPASDPGDAGFEKIDWWSARVDRTRYDAASGEGRSVTVQVTVRNDSSQARVVSERFLKARLHVGGEAVETARWEEVYPEAAGRPPFYYAKGTTVPPGGRAAIRLVFDVGAAERQALAGSISLVEQRPRSPLTPLNLVDGPSRTFPIERWQASGTSAAKAGTSDQPSASMEQMQRYAGRYRTSWGTHLTLAVSGDELAGEALTVDRPSPAEVVRLRVSSDGRATGTARRELSPGAYIWYNLSLIFSADGERFGGQAVASSAGVPASTYTGVRVRSGAGGSGGAASGTGDVDAPPLSLGDFEARLVRLARGDDGDWETTWVLANNGSTSTAISLHDLVVTLRSADGRSSEAAGPYHYADETGRRVRRSGFEIPAGEQTRIRVWHSSSKTMTPERFEVQIRGAKAQGQLPPLQ